mmetsp:Transcript_11504/g.23402  ORF Transcript_11504/g.23402 Transcript_11504/m.23402 type:complete len:537 (-) Transcript_11504:654-2264(-)
MGRNQILLSDYDNVRLRFTSFLQIPSSGKFGFLVEALARMGTCRKLSAWWSGAGWLEGFQMVPVNLGCPTSPDDFLRVDRGEDFDRNCFGSAQLKLARQWKDRSSFSVLITSSSSDQSDLTPRLALQWERLFLSRRPQRDGSVGPLVWRSSQSESSILWFTPRYAEQGHVELVSSDVGRTLVWTASDGLHECHSETRCPPQGRWCIYLDFERLVETLPTRLNLIRARSGPLRLTVAWVDEQNRWMNHSMDGTIFTRCNTSDISNAEKFQIHALDGCSAIKIFDRQGNPLTNRSIAIMNSDSCRSVSTPIWMSTNLFIVEPLSDGWVLIRNHAGFLRVGAGGDVCYDNCGTRWRATLSLGSPALPHGCPWVRISRTKKLIHVDSSIVIPCSPSIAFGVVTDYDGLHRFIGDMHASKRLYGLGRHESVIQLQESHSFLFVTIMADLVLEAREDPKQRVVSLTMRESNTLRHYEGKWQAIEENHDSCVLHFTLDFAMKMPVPKFIIEGLSQDSTRRSLIEVYHECLSRVQLTDPKQAKG